MKQERPSQSAISLRLLNADGLLVLVTLLAAVGWLFSRHSLSGMPPLLFIGIRFALAGLLVGVAGVPQFMRLSVSDLVRSCTATGLVFSAAMVFWILGLQHASNMGVGAFITSLGVIFAPVVGWALFRVRITRSTWMAVLVATAGMGCLSLQSGLRLTASDLYFVASACGFSLQFNLNSRYSTRVPVLPLTAVQLAMVGVVSLSISAFSETWPASVGAETISWVAASILISTCLRFFFQVKAQSMASVSHAALIMTLEPVWTTLIAIIWFDERMSGAQVAGCLLIMLALLINRWRWTS